MASTVTSDLPAATQTGERWLRIRDVMQATSLSRSTIYSLMESEKLKSIKVGGARRISASALAEFMRACDHGNTNGSASEVSRA
jgi:excisionase family DNA binding protein